MADLVDLEFAGSEYRSLPSPWKPRVATRCRACEVRSQWTTVFLLLIRFLLVTMVAGLASVGAMVLHAILR